MSDGLKHGPLGHLIFSRMEEQRDYSEPVGMTYGERRHPLLEAYRVVSVLSVKCEVCLSHWISTLSLADVHRIQESPSLVDDIAYSMASTDPEPCLRNWGRTCSDIQRERLVREVMES